MNRKGRTNAYLGVILGVLMMLPTPGARAWQIDPGLLEEYPILAAAIAAARRDVQSEEGIECFLSVEGHPLDTGMDPNDFDDDDEGPNIQVADLMGAYGVYMAGTTPDDITVDLDLVLDAQAGDPRSFELLVATIVHETTHWVDHQADGGADTPAEEGCAMEVWIYGWSKQYHNVDGMVAADTPPRGDDDATAIFSPRCKAVPATTLALAISSDQSTHVLGDTVAVTVALTNVSNQIVDVVDLFAIEGSFLTFDIFAPNGQRVPYSGPEIKPELPATLFLSLEPGESLVQTLPVNLPGAGYALDQVGTYTMSATYTLPPFGCLPFARYIVAGSVTTGTAQLTIVP